MKVEAFRAARSAGNGSAGITTGGRGTRSLDASRPAGLQKRRLVILLGVLLPLVGALAGFVVLTRSTGAVPVLMVRATVPAGDPINADALAVTQVVASGVDTVPAGERDTVIGQRATSTLWPGMLLSRSALGGVPVPADGQEMAAVLVESGHVPSQPIAPGARVVVVVTSQGRRRRRGQTDSQPAVRGHVPRLTTRPHPGRSQRARRRVADRPGRTARRGHRQRRGQRRPRPATAMSVIAVTSARSGGITTTTIALGLSWPTRSLVAECDPAGGTVWATTHRGRRRSRGGLRAVALSARRPDFTPTEFWAATQPLLDGRGHVLTGITDPAQLPVVAAKWGWLSEAFQALGYQQPPTDVIVDCGRLGTEGFPTPIVAAADCVLLLIQPTLADVSHAQGRVPALRAMLADGQLLKAALVCAGPYSVARVAEAVDLDVIADLPPTARRPPC